MLVTMTGKVAKSAVLHVSLNITRQRTRDGGLNMKSEPEIIFPCCLMSMEAMEEKVPMWQCVFLFCLNKRCYTSET